MKKLVLITLVLMHSVLVRPQNSAVDAMFAKYAEKEGFTVVVISSRMLSLFAGNDTEDKENLMRSLKSVRILAVGDSLMNRDINFYTELSRKLDLSKYEELLMVKEGPDMTKFLIRQNGDIIKELLVITGGPDGNSIISIEGDLNLKQISELSKNIDNEEMKKLEKLEEK